MEATKIITKPTGARGQRECRDEPEESGADVGEAINDAEALRQHPLAGVHQVRATEERADALKQQQLLVQPKQQAPNRRHEQQPPRRRPLQRRSRSRTRRPRCSWERGSRLRITGSLLLRETYAAPWAVAVPDSKGLSQLLGLPAGVRAVAFHLIEFGHCEIAYDRANSVLLKAGDMAVCFGDAAHRICAGKRPQTQAIAGLLSGGTNTQRPDGSNHAPTTSLLCGVFLLRHTELNPLVAALPCVVHSTLGRTGALHNLSGVARLLSDEMERASHGSGYVIERLVEAMKAMRRSTARSRNW